MKKVFSFVMLVMVSQALFAQSYLRRLKIEDERLVKKECWDKTLVWLSLYMDDYNAQVDYQNYESGTMIVKGKYSDKDNRLQVVENNIMKPIIGYALIITCKDGIYEAEYREITYQYRSGSGGFAGYSKYMLEWMKQELETIRDISYIKGDVWEIDDYFTDEYNEIQKKIKEEKERKELEKQANLENPQKEKTKKKKTKASDNFHPNVNMTKSSVYYHVQKIEHNLGFRTLYGTSDVQGLRPLIMSTIQ